MTVNVLGMFLLIFFIIVVGKCQGEQFAFFRCNNSTKTLQYVYFTDPTTSVYDIFSQSRMSTCSLRAGAFTGQGTPGDPYILEIDLKRGLVNQEPDCGVKQAADNSMRLEMVVQSSCSGVTSSDLRSTSSCRMVVPTDPQQISGSASYFCQPPSTIVFRFSGPTSATTGPADIYAVGKRATCSKMAGTGRGQGLVGDPFVMRINISDNNCGVQNRGNGVFNVTMYVQQVASLITSLDNSFLLTCNFTASAGQSLETVAVPAISNPPTSQAPPTASTSSLSVVSDTGSVAVTSLAVGDQIRLVAQLIDGPATGIRLTSCEATPGPGQRPAIQVIGPDGCSTNPVLVPPFIGQSPVGRQAITNVFRAFKFDQSDTVYFRCQASYCYDNDLSCLGSHCAAKTRRRRDVSPPRNESLVIFIRVVDNNNNNNNNNTDVNGNPRGSTSRDASPGGANNTLVASSPAGLEWPVSALVVVSCLSAVVVLCSVLTIWVVCRRGRSHKGGQDETPVAVR